MPARAVWPLLAQLTAACFVAVVVMCVAGETGPFWLFAAGYAVAAACWVAAGVVAAVMLARRRTLRADFWTAQGVLQLIALVGLTPLFLAAVVLFFGVIEELPRW